MKVAYVTDKDASNIRIWSGTTYYIAKSLMNQSISLAYIGPLKKKYLKIADAKKYFYRKLFHKSYLQDTEPLIIRGFARQVAQKLSKIQADIVLSPEIKPVAFLKCKQPIVFWRDATFAGMREFYPDFCNLCEESIRNGNEIEKSALDRCKLAIYSSEWAAETAIKTYQASSDKVKIVPFGANLECDRSLEDIKSIVDQRSTKICKLLFLGVDWQRKGGDIALEVAKRLNNSGLYTEFTVVGCYPPPGEPLPSFVKIFDFISKATEDGKKELNRILRESHFLILPTRADCSPISLCEANSFGVPCVSTKVGGIPTIIKDNLNGMLFNNGVDISKLCSYIYNLFDKYYLYKSLTISSFHEYKSRLNWDVAAKTVKNLLINII